MPYSKMAVKKKKKKTLMDENCFISLMQNKIILS